LFSDSTHPHSLGEATRTVHPHDISFLVWGGFFLTPTGVKTRLQRMAPSPKFVVGSCDACKQVGRRWSWESNAVVPASCMWLIVSDAFQFLLAMSRLVCTSVSYHYSIHHQAQVMVAGELPWISDQVKSVPLEFIQASTCMHAVYYYMPKVCIQGPKNTGTFWSFFWAKMFFAQRLLALPNSNPFVNILFLFQKITSSQLCPILKHFWQERGPSFVYRLHI
jgi:hypothetical protein